MEDDIMDDGETQEGNTPPTNKTSANKTSDDLFTFDPRLDQQIRTSKAWMSDPKYFKSAQVSVGAAMKMLNHAVAGVEKGMKSAGGKPVEVMGLLLGRPGQEDQINSLVVTDVFPVPVEGAETKVLADDQEVLNYMIGLGESLEKTRKERFMGWYHSHPFDVEVYSHCHLSGTDVNTQLQWQLSEDRNGNPWLAIVIDPLRSLAKGRPELGAYRVYPTGYSAPSGEAPDGTIMTNENLLIERWGNSASSYHSLEIKFFVSSLSARITESISKNVLWMNALTKTPTLEPENRDRFAERVLALTQKLKGNNFKSVPNRTLGVLSSKASDDALGNCAKSTSELSLEQSQAQLKQLMKYLLFCEDPKRQV